jgi:phosphoribosylglycinamide formyltransferase-1
MRVGVLCSGGGTNLQALLDAEATGGLEPAHIVLVISNNPGARALDRARQAGRPTRVLDHRGYADRTSFEVALLDALDQAGVELLVLAGFMRVLGATFLDRYPARVINIHPALLPSFPGIHAQRQALEKGVRITGCTVHFVDSGVDTGPIIAQSAVPVLDGDDEDSLSARILRQEHRLLPAVVRLVARGDVGLQGRRVTIAGKGLGAAEVLCSLPVATVDPAKP